MPTPLTNTIPSLHRAANSDRDIDLLPLHHRTPHHEDDQATSKLVESKATENPASSNSRPSSPRKARQSPPVYSSSSIPEQPDKPLLEEDSPSDSDHSTTSMSTRRNRRSKAFKKPPGDSPFPSTSENGNGGDDMNSHVELRRKTTSLDTSQVTENLLSRESFTLDDPVPHTPIAANNGFFQLSKKDQRNFMLLVLLYFLQGVPMGLATGSVPFLLKPKLSYSQIGVFSLASYPYSLKLLWSPIVDACWTPKVGRRKSWILPIQMLSGFGMIWLGANVQGMFEKAAADGGAGVWGFTGWWFFLVFMCATQDIAVDGWALTLISPGNISYASTAQTVGLTAGQFMSYTVFLALNAPDFANKWFRTTPSDVGVWTLSGYLIFWGWAYLAVTLGLALLKREEKTQNEDGIWDVYKVMWGVLKLKNIQTIIIIHLIAKIGFQANDAVTNLKLIDKGFSQEDLALTVLIDFPFEIGLGYYAGKWSTEYTPMRLWCWGFVGRLAAAVIAQIVVMIFPAEGVTTWYLLVIIAEHIFSTFTSTVMFVAVSAFHARIADPVIGGTYMTLLATVSNLGGTFPRYFILRLVDYFTAATCTPPSIPPPEKSLTGPLITSPFSCVLEPEKQRCIAGGGTCNMERDGYYITNVICVIIGIVTFVGFIKPAALKLQSLPLRAWRIGPIDGTRRTVS